VFIFYIRLFRLSLSPYPLHVIFLTLSFSLSVSISFILSKYFFLFYHSPFVTLFSFSLSFLYLSLLSLSTSSISLSSFSLYFSFCLSAFLSTTKLILKILINHRLRYLTFIPLSTSLSFSLSHTHSLSLSHTLYLTLSLSLSLSLFHLPSFLLQCLLFISFPILSLLRNLAHCQTFLRLCDSCPNDTSPKNTYLLTLQILSNQNYRKNIGVFSSLLNK